MKQELSSASGLVITGEQTVRSAEEHHVEPVALLEADVEPTLGGVEYAGDIVESLDLDAMVGVDGSLGRAIQNLRTCFGAGGPRFESGCPD